MKKITFCAISLFITAIAFSQQANPTQSLTQEEYLQKSKNQKTAAWVLLGSGALIDIIALATFPKDYDMIFGTNSPKTESKANTSAALFIAGGAAMLASIPFFVASRKNRNKAVSIALDTKQLNQVKNAAYHVVNYPALTMKIRL